MSDIRPFVSGDDVRTAPPSPGRRLLLSGSVSLSQSLTISCGACSIVMRLSRQMSDSKRRLVGQQRRFAMTSLYSDGPDRLVSPPSSSLRTLPRRWDERSECAWQKLLRSTTTEDAVALGIAASDDGRTDHAIEAFAYADELGSQDGALLLGRCLRSGGLDRAEAAGAGLMRAVMRRGQLVSDG